MSHEEAAFDDGGHSSRPCSRESSSCGPSQPRRAASLSPPPPVENQSFKTRFGSQRDQHQAFGSTILRNATNSRFDAVYNSVETKNTSVQVGHDLYHDLSDELETLSCFSRTGNFSLAKEFFHSHLEAHADDPAVFVQYGEMLLEQGDFRSVLLLDCRPVFCKFGREELEHSESGIHHLLLNWKLLRAVALCHCQHTLSTVWEGIEGPLKVAPNALDTEISSTEVGRPRL